MEDWSRVASALTARMRERGVSQKDLAERSGVSVATLRELQRGADRRRSSVTLNAIERALAWPDGHLRKVAHGDAGSDPDVASSGVADRLAALETRLDAQIAQLDARLSKVESSDRAS